MSADEGCHAATALRSGTATAAAVAGVCTHGEAAAQGLALRHRKLRGYSSSGGLASLAFSVLYFTDAERFFAACVGMS